MDTFWIPLMLATAGAAFGAYFAIIKTKREKLWTERYERIAAALEKTNLIQRYLDSEVNGRHRIHGLTEHEKAELDANWPIARYNLATDITMLQMLFSKPDFDEVYKRWEELQRKFFSLIEESMPQDAHIYFSAARPKAEKLAKALIALSRAKCLGFF